MNREIKFRFWNENRKEMSYEIEFKQNPKGINDAILIIQKVGLEIMQFTGLKDKNGIEIYEKDIVGISKESVLKNAPYYLAKEWNDIQVVEKREDEEREIIGYWKYDCNDFEVIGNIYENSELLNKKL